MEGGSALRDFGFVLGGGSVTDSGLAALSEPWHPTVYRVLVPSHLFTPLYNILSCTIVNTTTSQSLLTSFRDTISALLI